ncbi:MAG: glycerol-3-phosphate 1-O-acyltransferase PlsY [candidate division Zixibacteria bacterium]|nr:glycerol-3-phosphate 1-O-acyltransferase PlsY [candidate division Zixibacteria bacterium]
MLNLIPIIIGYLLGAIPFGLLISRLFGIRDIRMVGSGNIGATNVWRMAGATPALLVFMADIGKGIAAVWLASAIASNSDITEYLKLASGLAAVLGHIFPIYLRFKGGKGVNTALGVMITLLPLETIVALMVFILTVAISRYISLGSILASMAFFVIIIVEKIILVKYIHPIYIPTSLLLMILIIFTHRSNIIRLLQGNENRFSFHSSKESRAGNND